MTKCERCHSDTVKATLPDGQVVGFYCGDCHGITVDGTFHKFGVPSADNETIPRSVSDADDRLEDVYAELKGLHMSVDIEGRSKFDDRLLNIAEQINNQANRVRCVREDLRELSDRWHRKVNTPCVANECAEELSEVLENNAN